MKTKKLLVILLTIVMLLSSFSLVGCNYTPEKLEIVSGAPKEVDLYCTPSYSALKIKVTFVGGRTKTLSAKDVTISEVDTSTPGEQTVTVTFSGVSTTFTILVKNASIGSAGMLMGYELPTAFVSYNNNRKAKPDESKEGEFKNLTEPFYVGTDNAFKFLPRVIIFDVETQTSAILPKFESIVEVQVKSGSNFGAVLSTEQLKQYLEPNGKDDKVGEFDFSEGLFYFKNEAAGKTFKISQKPSPYTEYGGDASVLATVRSFEIDVISGMNVYGLSDLVHMCDRFENWDAYRLSNNLPIPGQAEWTRSKAYIFQHDFTLTMDMLPANFIDPAYPGYINQSSALGAGSGIFRTFMEPGSELSVIGNYFTFDVSGLYKLYTAHLGEGDKIDRRVNLFTFSVLSEVPESLTGSFEGVIDNATNKNIIVASDSVDFMMKNIKLVGNTPRGNNDTNFGGIYCMKNGTLKGNVTVDNIIANSFATVCDFSRANRTIIKDTKIYDSFSYALSYGGTYKENYIINSEIKRAGGPLILMDANEKGWYLIDGADSTVASNYIERTSEVHVNVDQNSVLENMVTSEELWFQAMGASALVTTVKALNFFTLQATANSRTYVKGTSINLIATMLTSGNVLSPTFQVKGGMHFKTFNDGVWGEESIGIDTTSTSLSAALTHPYRSGMPVFSGPNSAIGFINPTPGSQAFYGATPGTTISPTEISTLFGGKYLGIALPLSSAGSAICVLEMYNA